MKFFEMICIWLYLMIILILFERLIFTINLGSFILSTQSNYISIEEKRKMVSRKIRYLHKGVGKCIFTTQSKLTDATATMPFWMIK